MYFRIEHRRNRIACGVDDATGMLINILSEHLARGIKRVKGAAIIHGHQVRRARCVSGENRHQSMPQAGWLIWHPSELARGSADTRKSQD